MHKLSNVQSQWPQNAVVLPGTFIFNIQLQIYGAVNSLKLLINYLILCLGNEVIFSLETASDYMKNESSITYGFKCLVIGYDWITSGHGLKNLEIELSFLGGACAASLMKKNLLLPSVSCKYNVIEISISY